MSSESGSGREPESEYYETENGSVKFTPSSKAVNDEAEDAGAGDAEADGRKPEAVDRGFNVGIVASAENMKGFQIGAIGAEVDGYIDGMQLAGIFTEASGDVDGIQLAGIFASAEGDVDGLQFGGIWCETEGDVMGAQISGVWNSAHDVALAQVSGVFNVAEGKAMGAQVSGVFNIAEEKVFGAQIAGVFNTAADLDGLQLAGIMNVAEDVKGGQVGLLNFGGEVYGVQVGLINISEDLHGIPIGLINISENGLNDLSFWYSDNDFMNFGFQIGTSTVYSFLHAGFSENWSDAATVGIGMGLELGGDSFFVDTELYGKAYQEGRGSAAGNIQSIFSGAVDIFPAARISAGYEFFDFISVFAGVNIDCAINASCDGYDISIGELAASSYTVQPWTINDDCGSVQLYPTWFVGIRL